VAANQLGVIEGYFGRPWSWAERAEVASLLSRHGYGFFIYAPKADARLRSDWRLPFDEEQLATLSAFADHCRSLDMRFGVGLSPFEAWLDFGDDVRRDLTAKLAAFDAIGVDDLGILFDDMRGDLPDLAQRQVEIVDFAAGATGASRIIVCPSYYSDDPLLDRAFGERPPDYLAELGRRLDPAIHLFWTGEEVCSREFSPGHLERIAEQMRRKPFLWDNYPVNDGAMMSQHLHLRAFTGRPAAIGGKIAGHAVNPALQPMLSCIPMLTLPMSYAREDDYRYGAAFQEAACAVVGDELAAMLLKDLLALQDVGLDNLGARRSRLRERYADLPDPAAREVVAWLDGGYAPDGEQVQTQ
jgi:hypothetical protein